MLLCCDAYITILFADWRNLLARARHRVTDWLRIKVGTHVTLHMGMNVTSVISLLAATYDHVQSERGRERATLLWDVGCYGYTLWNQITFPPCEAG